MVSNCLTVSKITPSKSWITDIVFGLLPLYCIAGCQIFMTTMIFHEVTKFSTLGHLVVFNMDIGCFPTFWENSIQPHLMSVYVLHHASLEWPLGCYYTTFPCLHTEVWAPRQPSQGIQGIALVFTCLPRRTIIGGCTYIPAATWGD